LKLLTKRKTTKEAKYEYDADVFKGIGFHMVSLNNWYGITLFFLRVTEK
jgi:hypothetical protein